MRVSPTTKPSPATPDPSDSSAGGIVIADVMHEYRPPRGRPVLALDRLNLTIRPREFIALLGPSGCGKSTLLYLIGGFMPIQHGSIEVGGKPVTGPGPAAASCFSISRSIPGRRCARTCFTG
jgi:ABC-type taurine transport system ATPase subunit